MAYLEKDELETLCRKLENICEENHLAYRLVTKDPISIVVQPDMTMEGQISMLDNSTGYNGKDSSLVIYFVDADVEYKFTGGFAISKKLLSKLLNAAQKIHYMYLWVFFRDTLEQRRREEKQASTQYEDNTIDFLTDRKDLFAGMGEE